MSEPPPGFHDRVKVVFELDREDEDWPPTGSESLWARPLGDDEYELDNVPWFARGIAYGDRVWAEPDGHGVLTAREKLEWSGHYTIRVIPLGEGPSASQVQDVIDAFSALGVSCEGALPAYELVALDVPPTAPLAEVKALLIDGEVAGRWGYEEGCIDEAWRAL